MGNEEDIEILVVDDTPANILAIESMIEGDGTRVVRASSGEEALVQAGLHDFALILLDVRLPGIDGLTTAQRLRGTRHARDVPIIFLTAFDTTASLIDRAYSLGAVDFLNKPIIPQMLMAKMSVFIELHRKTQAIKRQGELLRQSQTREHKRRMLEERAIWEAEQLRREVILQTNVARERELYAVILDCIKEAVVAVDEQRRVILLNKAAEELFGQTSTEAQGAEVDRVVHLIDPVTNRRVFPESITGDVIMRRNGTTRILADSMGAITDERGSRRGSVFVFKDVTTQRHMEQDIANQQRIESLGVLAGGIAHDFNNMLGMISASADLLKLHASEGKAAQLADGIQETCERASNLTHQLLTFARGGSPIKKPCNPEELIRSSVELALKGGRIRCEYELEGPLWVTDLDAGQMTQVFSNLVLNAREATGDQGTIKVKAKNIWHEDTSDLPLEPGPYVEVRVEDEGPGIRNADIDHIFEPYFSTKPDHHGLGLASSYSVARKHGGLLRVDPTSVRGAALVVCLPARPEAMLAEEDATSQCRTAVGGRVLVMDDEPILRDLLADCLVALKCRVDVSEHGGAAIEAYQKAIDEGDPFDVVILDLTIRGGMGGEETLRRLQEISPDVLAVACSGYANDEIMCNYEENGFAAAIKKPFRFQPLARIIRSLVTQQREKRQSTEKGRTAAAKTSD